ncbi:putative oligosaccharyl transferase subunit [Trypanosoma cruzi]|uniref:Putative oligosaccharyl transferase subunit n=1 Tax=Trypanosoma cruzi TaxID=5693 RepID=A0A2V2WUP3_TRYCR|nr:putative oligosaccharyl transferase subunit [Trypanosoma cruzi]
MMLGGVMDLSVDSLFLPPGVCEDGKKRQMKGRHKQKDLGNARRLEFHCMEEDVPPPTVFCCSLVGGSARVGWACSVDLRYREHCHQFAEAVSGPQIIMRAQLRTGEIVMLDDLLRLVPVAAQQHTGGRPAFLHGGTTATRSRGSGIARALADGNTGITSTLPQLESCLRRPWRRPTCSFGTLPTITDMDRSRAEDLMKSPHMARIGNSVYPRHLPEDDPLCSNFGFETTT